MKNSLISVFGQILSMILQLVNRRVFILFLEIELLGYQSLFGNIFSILSVAELGIGNIITFHLYREVAKDNRREIGKLMYLYRWIYRMIAAFVLAAGILCGFFLPYIVKKPQYDWKYLYLVYTLQLGAVIAGYFLSYRRTIYVVSQKGYYCVMTDLAVSVVVQGIQIVTLFCFHNYLLYLLIQLSKETIANIIIAGKSNREYPYLKGKYKLTKKDIADRNIIPDMKNFFIHRICYTVYSGTDNIVISAFCGIRDVALYGNYYYLKCGVMNILFYKLLDPLQAAIGNILYGGETKQNLWDKFQTLDVFSYFFASYIGTGFLIFFQPVMCLWMGSEYLLPFSFVAVYSATIYFSAVWEIVYKYRSVFGNYAQDRNCMMISAVVNITSSVMLARVWGVTGVQTGTLIAFFPIAYGRIRFVVKHFFGQALWKYFLKHGMLFAVTAVEAGMACWMVREAPVSVGGLLLRAVVWAVIPLLGNVAIYRNNRYFKELMKYLKDMIKIVRRKCKRRRG